MIRGWLVAVVLFCVRSAVATTCTVHIGSGILTIPERLEPAVTSFCHEALETSPATGKTNPPPPLAFLPVGRELSSFCSCVLDHPATTTTTTTPTSHSQISSTLAFETSTASNTETHCTTTVPTKPITVSTSAFTAAVTVPTCASASTITIAAHTVTLSAPTATITVPASTVTHSATTVTISVPTGTLLVHTVTLPVSTATITLSASIDTVAVSAPTVTRSASTVTISAPAVNISASMATIALPVSTATITLPVSTTTITLTASATTDTLSASTVTIYEPAVTLPASTATITISASTVTLTTTASLTSSSTTTANSPTTSSPTPIGPPTCTLVTSPSGTCAYAATYNSGTTPQLWAGAAASLDACALLCDGEPGCLSIAYNPSSTLQCVLFNTVTSGLTTTSDAGSSTLFYDSTCFACSGTAPRPLTDDNCTPALQPPPNSICGSNFFFLGGAPGTINGPGTPASTLGACMQLCLADSSCQSVSFDGTTCVLYAYMTIENEVNGFAFPVDPGVAGSAASYDRGCLVCPALTCTCPPPASKRDLARREAGLGRREANVDRREAELVRRLAVVADQERGLIHRS